MPLFLTPLLYSPCQVQNSPSTWRTRSKAAGQHQVSSFIPDGFEQIHRISRQLPIQSCIADPFEVPHHFFHIFQALLKDSFSWVSEFEHPTKRNDKLGHCLAARKLPQVLGLRQHIQETTCLRSGLHRSGRQRHAGGSRWSGVKILQCMTCTRWMIFLQHSYWATFLHNLTYMFS